MAAPAYASASAGARNGAWSSDPEGGAVSITYQASIASGDLLLVQFQCRAADTPATPSGYTSLYADATGTGTIEFKQTIFGKIAAGTESGTTLDILASGVPTVDDASGRIYRITGNANPATFLDLFESAAVLSGNDASIEAPSVTTTGAEELAVAFVCVSDDNAVASFTGETNGDWTEAVAEYSNATGDDFCLQLQTATLNTAVALSGGSQTMALADPWVVRAFAIKSTVGGAAATHPGWAGAGWW